MGDTLIALLAARELELVKEAEFDAHLTPLLDTLNRLMLTDGDSPDRLYSTQTATPVDFGGRPAASGWPAKDVARLMLALRLTAGRAPRYGEYIDKIILRWDSCPVIDKDGELWFASLQNGQRTIREELRLGDSEYAASTFRLWRFPAGKVFSPPVRSVIMYQHRLAADDRGPRTTWQPVMLSTLSAMLSRLKFGWWPSDVPEEVQKAMREWAGEIWLSQKTRWTQDKVLTTRADFPFTQAPWHVENTAQGNGYIWSTLEGDGKYYPRLVQVTTKVVFVLWTLWETEYTGALMAVTTYLNDPQRGWFKGQVETTGDTNAALILSTGAMVLGALFYKHNAGPLFKNGLADDDSYFAHHTTDEFDPPRHCLPGERIVRSAPWGLITIFLKPV